MPTPADIQAAERARRAAEANTSARFRALDRLERFVAGTQYEGLPSFWDDDTPLLDRAPCIVYPIVDCAIRSHTSLVLGEGRFPVLTMHGDDDDAADHDGLDADAAAVLDRLIAKTAKQVGLRSVSRQLLEAAMGSGTAVAILCARNGRLTVDTTLAKWCTPTFALDDRRVVTALEIRYVYTVDELGPDRRPHPVCKLYRRMIDAVSDTTYHPENAAENGSEPQWRVASQVDHGFGFCPVVWYRFMAGCGTVAEIDGHAIHEKLLDEVTAHDFAVSQRHRATMSTLDPILVEIGVDEDEQPAPLGAMASSPYMTPDMQAAEAANGRYRSPRAGPVKMGRKRAPGMAYQYRDSAAKVDMLTLPGDAMQAGTDNARDIEAKLAESLHWVPIDPKTLQTSAQMSGRAIEWLHKKQIEFCNEVRTDVEQHLLLPLVDMLLRMALSFSRRDNVGLYLSGLADAAPLLVSFERPAEGGTVRWMPPDVCFQWPAYFPPTESDEKAAGDATRADYKAGLITLRTAVEKRAAYYAVGNVDQYVDDLHRVEHERAEAEHRAAEVLTAAAVPDPNADAEPPSERAPSRPPRVPRPSPASATLRPIGPLLARAPSLAAA
jgi:hypothetical protein